MPLDFLTTSYTSLAEQIAEEWPHSRAAGYSKQ